MDKKRKVSEIAGEDIVDLDNQAKRSKKKAETFVNSAAERHSEGNAVAILTSKFDHDEATDSSINIEASLLKLQPEAPTTAGVSGIPAEEESSKLFKESSPTMKNHSTEEQIGDENWIECVRYCRIRYFLCI